MHFSKLLPWQTKWWSEAQALLPRLPHAVVFHGQRGSGKVGFARYFGQALLCQSPDPNARPCGSCPSCAWVQSGNHPDLRLLRPEAIELAEGVELADSNPSDGEGGAPDAEAAETSSETSKGKRAPSKEIRIQQVRRLAELLEVSSHRGGRRVAILYPADAMNVFTANALLKLLEEPPEDTVFLLVTDTLDRLLPTILSRCRKFALAPPERAAALAWLVDKGVAAPEDALAEQGGAPLAALAAAQDAEGTALLREGLLAVLSDPKAPGALGAAERLQKCEPALVVGWIQRWLYDCVGYRLAGRIRYYPRHQGAIAALAGSLDLGRSMTYLRTLDQERRVSEHPLNARLFVENLILGYLRMFKIQ